MMTARSDKRIALLGLLAAALAALSCRAGMQAAVQNAEAVTAFVSRLEVDSGGRDPASLLAFPTPDDDTSWARFAAAAPGASEANPRDVSDYFEGPLMLVDGDTIHEMQTPIVEGRSAVATCLRGRRVIMYDPKWIMTVSASSLAFIREHERAHHALHHVDCSPGEPHFKDPRTRDDEHAADCGSVAVWDAAGIPGVWVMASAAERFHILAGAGNAQYPSDQERAEYIRRLCR